jgi:plasmid stability protein
MYFLKGKEEISMDTITTIRLPDDIKEKIKMRANFNHRTMSNQLEVTLRLALIAEENPDLPLQFIKDILEAKAEKEMGLAKPFKV